MRVQANGMDIIATAQAVKYAREWVIAGKGPLLLEFVTYRYGGHSCVFTLNRRNTYADPSHPQHVRPWNHLPYP